MADTHNSQHPLNSRLLILGLAIGLEGLLALVFLLWSEFRGYAIPEPRAADVFLGSCYALLLLFLNMSLLRLERVLRAGGQHVLASTRALVDDFCKPLADALGPVDMIVISLAAGVGEELFFRVVLQQEFGLLIANALFAFLHFGFAARRFLVPVLLYFVVGCFFSFQVLTHQSVFAAIAAHAVYDFIALSWLKWRYVPVKH